MKSFITMISQKVYEGPLSTSLHMLSLNLAHAFFKYQMRITHNTYAMKLWKINKLLMSICSFDTFMSFFQVVIGKGII